MPRPLVAQCCLAEQIRDAVADRIAAGDYPPGQRLVELALAKEFGTSQAPVREALRLLAGLRLVEVTPRRGTRVREVTDRELWETIVVRAGLELAAAETGAAAHFAADPNAVAELRQLNAAMAKVTAKGKIKKLVELNAEFHRRIVAAAGNETLLAMWETFVLGSVARISPERSNADLKVIVGQHDGIVAALVAGDGVEAGRRLWDHSMHFARKHLPDPATS